MVQTDSLDLFGRSLKWDLTQWTDIDDRVRGGKSQSNFRHAADNHALFYGTLDIDTLGGAGFASQRTTGDDRTWNLSTFDGIEIEISLSGTDDKRYTFILKDELLPPNPDNGREQSTISWEHDFRLPQSVTNSNTTTSSSFIIPWQQFEPTYRGKKKEDAGSLETSNIKRFSVMMRSFFGTQKGDFSLEIVSIKAVHLPHGSSVSVMQNTEHAASSDSITRLKSQPHADHEQRTSGGMLSWLFGMCCKL